MVVLSIGTKYDSISTLSHFGSLFHPLATRRLRGNDDEIVADILFVEMRTGDADDTEMPGATSMGARDVTDMALPGLKWNPW